MSTSLLPALAEGQLRLARASWAGEAGDLLVIPDARHALHADEDFGMLLTVARR